VTQKAVREFIGSDTEVIKHGSPLRRASQIQVPVLLFHGDQDLNVSVDHSKKMAMALKRGNKSVEYIEYEDVAHSIRLNDYRVDLLDRIGSFLDANIGQVTEPRSPAVSAAEER
jgi:dipeptidyl aminopeptidase/acylaminoacyl peptidase